MSTLQLVGYSFVFLCVSGGISLLAAAVCDAQVIIHNWRIG